MNTIWVAQYDLVEDIKTLAMLRQFDAARGKPKPVVLT